MLQRFHLRDPLIWNEDNKLNIATSHFRTSFPKTLLMHYIASLSSDRDSNLRGISTQVRWKNSAFKKIKKKVFSDRPWVIGFSTRTALLPSSYTLLKHPAPSSIQTMTSWWSRCARGTYATWRRGCGLQKNDAIIIARPRSRFTSTPKNNASGPG